MSTLAIVVVILLIVALLGGIGPTFYSGAPWGPGYGGGGLATGGIGVALVIVLLLAFLGHF